jgi:hypothetical protein
LRDLAGDRPFRAALEGGDETDAALGGVSGPFVVAEGGVEDAALAERDDEQERFVFTRPASFRGRASTAEH